MLKITNIPTGEKISNDFVIKLNGLEAKAYTTRVSAMPFDTVWPGHQRPLDQTEEVPVLSFIMDEPVAVELVSTRAFEDVVIRPLSKGIVPEISGNTIRFTLNTCGQYTVELDGWHKPLTIFANPNTDFDVCPEDPNVIYFPAGVHHPGEITIESNQTIYIDTDAVVYGSIIATQAKNIKILGYGILDGSWEKRDNNTRLVPCDFARRFRKEIAPWPADSHVEGSVLLKDKETFLNYLTDTRQLKTCIHLYNCENCEINGVTLRDSSGFTVIPANCENVIIDNIKIIGNWRYNSDGVDFFNSRNCVLRNSFLRCFDDCVVLKGIIGWDTWNMENILVENCVVWCDWGRNLEIGAETCAPEYRNIIFRNCDCIHLAHIALDVQHCDYAYIHDVIFEDINVEYSKYDEQCVYQKSDDMVYIPQHAVPVLIYAGISPSSYCFCIEQVKGTISNITFKNIRVFTDNEEKAPKCILDGRDEQSNVENIKFQNITMNGKPFDVQQNLQKTAPVKNVIIEP